MHAFSSRGNISVSGVTVQSHQSTQDFTALKEKKKTNTNKKSRLPKFLASILHNEHANKISTSADSCKVPEIRKISNNKSEAAYCFRSRTEISP